MPKLLILSVLGDRLPPPKKRDCEKIPYIQESVISRFFERDEASLWKTLEGGEGLSSTAKED
jgi:hypothetical protein